jgi:hypothetical protein
MFKEFGVRLNFTPTVTSSGRVRLKVKPEVSTLDFANAVVLEGFRIPALSTRRTETELELANGQTFAIAGLLNNTATESMHKIPGLGDIPILGYLFRSKAAQKNRTELVVMITPEILPVASPGVTSETPRLKEPYLEPLPENRSFPAPGPAFTPQGDNPALVRKPTGTAYAAPTVTPATGTSSRTPNPEAAAAVLRAGMPKGPTMMTLETAPAAAAVPPSAAAPAGTIADPIVTPQETTVTAPVAPAPEARPLTRAERREIEKAREEERKAEERRRKEEEKAAKEAQKQAEKDARDARKAAELALKSKSEG